MNPEVVPEVLYVYKGRSRNEHYVLAWFANVEDEAVAYIPEARLHACQRKVESLQAQVEVLRLQLMGVDET